MFPFMQQLAWDVSTLLLSQTVSGHGLGFIMHLRPRQFAYIYSLLKAEKA